MLIFAMKAKIFLPEAQSLKDKRQIRHSLVERLRSRNISVIEAARQDEHKHLELLLSFASLSEEDALQKREYIEGIFYDASEHVSIEDELISVE